MERIDALNAIRAALVAVVPEQEVPAVLDESSTFLTDLNIHSLETLDVAAKAQLALRVKIGRQSLSQIQSVGELVDLLLVAPAVPLR